MTLEYKKLDIEIKATDEQGTFEGVLSPYNNVDFGNDRVMPSIGKRNDNKTIPYLWQHDPHSPIGELKLKHSDTGMTVQGKLFLDKDDNGQYLIPKAAETYALMKRKVLKLSIGYQTLDYEYVVEGKKTIRNLKDIDIIEGSAVTFPMNPQAKITNVKEEGGDEEMEVEEKAMTFNELLKLRESNEMRWQLQDALNGSTRQLIEEPNMTADEKIKQLNQNVDEFSTAYKETMSTIIKASAKKNKKEFIDLLNSKNDDEKDVKTIISDFKSYISLETKDTSNMTDNIKKELKDLTEQLDGLLKDEESKKQQEKANDGNIEAGEDESEEDLIKSLYKTIKGGNE